MSRLIGILLVACSAAAFGTLAIFARYAYASGMNAGSILFLRFTLAALVMGVIVVVRREGLPRGRTLLWLIGMGAIGYVGQSFCYLSALNYASAGLVALLLYLYPIFVTGLSAFFYHERITGMKAIALALAFAGTALTVSPESGQWQGIALAIGAALIYSGYIMIGAKVMRHTSAVQSSTVIFASAAAVFGGMVLATGPQWPGSSSGWLAMVGLVIVATIIPAGAFLGGLKRIHPATAAMLSTLEPVVTVVLATVLLGETLAPVTLLGGALILGAVIIVAGGELGDKETGRQGQGDKEITN
ncbi:MAG: EamA family transporter [Anaerolineales bacterium]|nr:EamA family transporter [Anaerolineales bacterium]